MTDRYRQMRATKIAVRSIVKAAKTSLHNAARNGKLEDLKSALDYGIPANVFDVEGRTPLMLAAEHGHKSCVETLLQNGANPIFNGPLRSNMFPTALHSAIKEDHLDCLELLVSKTNIHRFILACHPRPNAGTDTMKKTKKKAFTRYSNLVSFAIENKSYRCLKFLLDCGFSPDSLIICDDLSEGLLPPVDLGYFEPAISVAVSVKDTRAMRILHDAGALSDTSPVHECFYIHPIIRALDLSSSAMLDALFELYGNNFGKQFFEWHKLFQGSFDKTNRIRNLLMYGYKPEKFLRRDSPFTMFRFAALIMSDQSSLVKTIEFILEFVTINSYIQKDCQTVIGMWKLLPGFDEALWASVMHKISNPSRLTHICRMNVRHHLYVIHGPGFVRLLGSLPTPKKLRDFLSFDAFARKS